MKLFQQRQIREAKEHAASGGQALHLMAGSFAYLRSDTPACFKGRATIAHLFDQDCARLEATARKLGVRKILVERVGTPGQHVDLCGKPLARALDLAAKAAPAIVCNVCAAPLAATDAANVLRRDYTGTGNPALVILAVCPKCAPITAGITAAEGNAHLAQHPGFPMQCQACAQDFIGHGQICDECTENARTGGRPL